MKKFATYIILIFTSISFSQTTFKKGYFISNDNTKTECLIKDSNWLKNPTEFKYKLSDESSTENITLDEVKEFAVYDLFKFIKANVEIDQSEKNNSKLSRNKAPEFAESEVLLKILIEGKANLYSYTDNISTKFFYNLNDLDIKPLIYKLYQNDDNKIEKNNTFRMQLWENLKFPEISLKDVKKLNYNANSLISFFRKFNEANNANFDIYKVKKEILKLSIRPGVNFSSLSVEPFSGEELDFGNKITFRLGAEAEFTLPFNNNKWAIVIEPTYSYYKGEINNSGSMIKLDYSAIEIPIGLRHYFFLSPKAKLFLNAGFSFDLINNTTIEIGSLGEGEINSGQNFMLGLGFNSSDKISFEIRYYSNKDLSRRGATATSNLSTLSLIFGYRLL
ncbi:porin family protein [Winogradskyella forsetii]|uniref:porin family protein n=1 Tax=Winogradskyella forsetii TaxID=2686077 RepID=UPI0015BD6CFD|nr:porin family protein [Winogradskyella forsetii]